MKEVALYQLETVTEVTISVGNGIKKSVKRYTKDAKRFVRSVSEFVDVEDVMKSIDGIVHQDEYARRRSSIIHTPIDWSKYPPSAFRRGSHGYPTTVVAEDYGKKGEINDESYGYSQRPTINDSMTAPVKKKLEKYHYTKIMEKDIENLDNRSYLAVPSVLPSMDHLGIPDCALGENCMRSERNYQRPSPRPGRKNGVSSYPGKR